MKVPRGLFVVFVIFVQVYLKYRIDVEVFIRKIEVKKLSITFFVYFTFLVIFAQKYQKMINAANKRLNLVRIYSALVYI